MKKPFSFTRRQAHAIGAVCLAFFAIITGKRIYDMAVTPTEDKNCDFTFPKQDPSPISTITFNTLEEAGVVVYQIGGTINDASCLNKTPVYAIAQITHENDVAKSLEFARENNIKITPSGERHSMGGQSFSRGGLILDMRGLNDIYVDEDTMSIRVGSGASWEQIQSALDPMGLAVKAMQSINLFTVGGTISVNAHGIAHDPGQVGPTIRSMRIMRADGTIETVSGAQNAELFSAVLGGYGLSAIILEVELDIVKNDVYAWKTDYIDYTEFNDFYTQNVIENDTVGLMYARLSIAPGSYLTETAVHRYVQTDGTIEPKQLGQSEKVGFKRFIFNLSKTGSFGRWVRWVSEKKLEPGYHRCVTRNNVMSGTPEEVCVATRNQKMNQSMEYLDTKLKDTNILNEYFIPKENTVAFIDGLRDIIKETDVNLLNVTLRIVTKDTLSALPYAKDDRIAYVLYFNQKLNDTDSEKLKVATVKLIDLATSLGGTYYLPYQLHYSPEQLRAAYPEIETFFALKKKYDPEGLFSNAFYEKYGS